MASPDNQAILSTIFDNPVVKGALAGVTVVAAIVKYIKEAGERHRRAATIAKRYGFTGIQFWIIDRFPHALHLLIAWAILVAAFVEASVIGDQYLFGSAFLKALPWWGQAPINFLSASFVGLFLVALLFYLMFELRIIERGFGFFVGLVPAWRQTLEWANAEWQIDTSSGDAPALAPAAAALEQWANALIDELTSSQRSPSLALRPANLSQDSAANILYFGHVVEEYCSEKLSRYFAWTAFYQALGEVAERRPAPFLPDSIQAFSTQNSFFSVLLLANDHLDAANQIPNEAGLESAVEKAFRNLQSRWDGDARNMSKGVFGTDYGRVLRSSAFFLEIEGMRRQYAKLFIIWAIKPDATHPDVFRIPLNTGIFVKYIDRGIILVQGERFDLTSERVSICFEAIQRKIVKRVFDLLMETKDAPRTAWRQTECTDVTSRKLNWTWWVYYRVDTQAYASSRGYNSTSWRRSGNEIVASKTY